MMNTELINRLATQVGLEVILDSIFTPEVDYGGEVGEVSMQIQEWLIPFAALIAEECAKITESTLEGYSEDNEGGWKIFGENSAAEIRKCFTWNKP